MRVVDSKGTIVAYVEQNKIETKDPYLLGLLQLGIKIPFTESVNFFNGKRIVRIGDDNFLEAFKRVFYKENLEPIGFTLISDSSPPIESAQVIRH